MQTSPDPSRTGLPPVPALAAEIAEIDGGLGQVADRLLAEHVSDPLGYCRGCELPQAGPTRWPCTLWAVAETARGVLRSRGLPRV